MPERPNQRSSEGDTVLRAEYRVNDLARANQQVDYQHNARPIECQNKEVTHGRNLHRIILGNFRMNLLHESKRTYGEIFKETPLPEKT